MLWVNGHCIIATVGRTSADETALSELDNLNSSIAARHSQCQEIGRGNFWTLKQREHTAQNHFEGFCPCQACNFVNVYIRVEISITSTDIWQVGEMKSINSSCIVNETNQRININIFASKTGKADSYLLLWTYSWSLGVPISKANTLYSM